MAMHFNHIPGGSNVLYMDGHVEFQRFAGHSHFPLDKVGLGFGMATHMHAPGMGDMEGM
jgi:prepilin-type processing-associated H-X9-DG protein